MARRKDHSPEELKAMILEAAEKIIDRKGLDGLTARSLATAIGYTPGTIYNFYRDMGAVVIDINFETLGRLATVCRECLSSLPDGYAKVKALAYAYVDFAHDNVRAWETLFAATRKGDKTAKLPEFYRERLQELFLLIEHTLATSLRMPAKEACATARLLWAALHGITVLTLDGRLSMVGVDKPHKMIDDLLNRYLAAYLKT